MATASAINHADEIVKTSVRGTVNHGPFPDVNKKILRDKHLRHKQKHFPNIVRNIGIEYLKVPDLDQRAYVLK